MNNSLSAEAKVLSLSSQFRVIVGSLSDVVEAGDDELRVRIYYFRYLNGAANLRKNVVEADLSLTENGRAVVELVEADLPVNREWSDDALSAWLDKASNSQIQAGARKTLSALGACLNEEFVKIAKVPREASKSVPPAGEKLLHSEAGGDGSLRPAVQGQGEGKRGALFFIGGASLLAVPILGLLIFRYKRVRGGH